MPSRIEPATSKVAAITSASPSLKASMYRATAASGVDVTASGRASRRRRLQLQRLLDLVGGDIRILAVLEEARALVLANELYECVGVRLPVLGKPSRLLNAVSCRSSVNSATASSVYLSKSVSKMPWYMKCCRPDVEQHPAEVVQLQRCEHVGAPRDRLLDLLAVRSERFLAALLHLGDDRKPVAGRGSRINRTISAPFEFEIPFFRDGHRGGFCPVLICHIRPPFALLVHGPYHR